MLDYLLVTNADFWDGLPPDIRPVLDGCVAEATQVANDAALAMDEKDKAVVAAAGGAEILALSATEVAAWRDAMKPVWQQFADEIGVDVLAAASAGR